MLKIVGELHDRNGTKLHPGDYIMVDERIHQIKTYAFTVRSEYYVYLCIERRTYKLHLDKVIRSLKVNKNTFNCF